MWRPGLCLHPSQRNGVLNPLIHPYIFIEMKKTVSGSLRLASPARRRDKGHRAEVDDGPWTKTFRVIVLLIGFGLGRARHGRPTSQSGYGGVLSGLAPALHPGLHPVAVRGVYTPWGTWHPSACQ